MNDAASREDESMTSEDVFKKVRNIIIEIKPGLNISENTHLRKDLELDSLDLISFFFELEKVFDIKIPESDIQDSELFLIANIIQYIEAKKSA